MYKPKKYQKNRPEYIFSFIQKHPFATVIINGNHLLATHIPILTEGCATDFRLYGHVALHNEILSFMEDGAEILLVFQGADGYISSSWYKNKDISTWDYSAVHINARIKMQGEKELRESLDKLLSHFEQHQQNPMYLHKIPKQMVEENIRLIRGFWCEPTKIQGIAKLHQGFSNDDINSIILNLEKEYSPNLSALSCDIKKEHDTNNQ